MTCAERLDSYRLLDARTGWDVESRENVSGFDDPAGIHLAPRLAIPGAVSVGELVSCLPPARTARGPSGRLYVASPTGLRVLDVATGCLRRVDLPDEPAQPSALASGRGLLALADRGAGAVDLYRVEDLRLVLRLPMATLGGHPRLVALTPWSLVAVVTEHPYMVALIGVDGVVRAHRRLPAARHAAELGMVCVPGDDGVPEPALVLAVRVSPGWRRLFRLDPGTLAAEPLDPARLRCPPAPPQITVADDESWTVRVGDRTVAFTADGEPSDRDAPPPARRYADEGHMTTVSLDSGLDDCLWHRVRLDARQPPGSSVQLLLSTVDSTGAASDWQTVPAGATDALIQLPPGRWLRVELRLRGNGTATPVVRQVKLDFDVSTSLDLLPEVYRADATTADFTRRFLSLFDASLHELDEVFAQAPLLFDAVGGSERILGALARAVGIQPDPGWPPDRLRALLTAWPRIWPRLGTAEGLCRLVSVVYGVRVSIDEVGTRRPWGALGSARLGQVHLFGLARASLRLGTGRLGVARLDPQADPLAPAYASGAFRCVIHAPYGLPAATRRGLESLIRTFLPGHVTAAVRYAPAYLVVGQPLAVGVGTRLNRLATGVLNGTGEHAVVLGRRGPLGRRGGSGAPVTVGRRPLAGITTTVR